MNIKILLALIFSVLFSLSTFSGTNPDQKMFLEDEKNSISVFQESAESVVNVSSLRTTRNWWDTEAVETPAGAGSGFIWDEKGHIVTNYHVVVEGGTFRVSFHNDQKQYEATVVGVEPNKDIAVLKLSEKISKTLKPIRVGSSKELIVGQKALAIGNPFGFDHSMTTGIISALGRQFKSIGGLTIRDVVQTDASINPGNSGGPLLDSSGKLIGMNTMIVSPSQSSAGLGFAIPVDEIKKIVPQLILYGKVKRPSLGIALLPENLKERFGIEKGMIISGVDKRGPALKAGLQGMSQDRRGRIYLGDIIVAINGKEINSYDDIYYALDEFKAGDTVEVTYVRDGKTQKTKIVLQKI